MHRRSGRLELLTTDQIGGIEIKLKQHNIVVQKIHDRRLDSGRHLLAREVKVHWSDQLDPLVQLSHGYLSTAVMTLWSSAPVGNDTPKLLLELI